MSIDYQKPFIVERIDDSMEPAEYTVVPRTNGMIMYMCLEADAQMYVNKKSKTLKMMKPEWEGKPVRNVDEIDLEAIEKWKVANDFR